MTVYGHETLVRSLRQYFAPVSAFVGPRGVGKWTVAEHLRSEFSVAAEDVLRIHRLDLDAVEALNVFASTPPASSDFKLAIVELLSGSRRYQPMLYPLAEFPRSLKIIFIAEQKNIDAGLQSRCVSYKFPRLRPDDVSSILTRKMNFSVERARELAAVSGGQVSTALSVADAEPSLDLVRRAVLALRVKDEEALGALAKDWTDEASQWLVEWCHEAVSGHWRAFSEEDRIDSPVLPLRILKHMTEPVRPRLVVRSQLMSALKG